MNSVRKISRIIRPA
ncbi:hypothetical protein [Caulobacter sp. RL271]|uniref:Uncharacterized protein n=1 Tax=Caulobacter segnis TaxID=88688 RepID=A0ABY5A0B6_9CAUL|nr:hypothetical protein [Caulobacter segnis]USQ98491.1 hypothetical protein MZV50_03370 [Caulobacter segnis]